jgi:hypothetical protein
LKTCAQMGAKEGRLLKPCAEIEAWTHWTPDGSKHSDGSAETKILEVSCASGGRAGQARCLKTRDGFAAIREAREWKNVLGRSSTLGRHRAMR